MFTCKPTINTQHPAVIVQQNSNPYSSNNTPPILGPRKSLKYKHGNIINKAKKFKHNTSKFVKSLKNLIHKGYHLATIVDSLRQVYFAKNIDMYNE